MGFSSVIIIGAPRSGTNMLRDVLTALPGMGTWPCDEINYIWRHGNVPHPDDELTVDMARPRVVRYIRDRFSDIARQSDVQTVVEKTCANSLRVAFVDRVMPDSKYIFIYRDGFDVVASAIERWGAPLDLSYVLRKARYIPLSDIPYYGSRYVWNRLYKNMSGSKRLALWGPVFRGMRAAMRVHSLAEICGLQWQACVEKADGQLSMLPDRRVYRVSYETFVENPMCETERICRFIGISVRDDEIKKATDKVSSRSVGRGRRRLGANDISDLRRLISRTMDKYGYD